MGVTFSGLDAIAALASGDLFVADDVSESKTTKVTMAQLISFIEATGLSGIPLNAGAALSATSTEIDAVVDWLATVTASAAEINAACDGIGVTIPKVALFEITNWDMTADTSKTVTHSLTFGKIVGVSCMIFNDGSLDGGTGYGYPIGYWDTPYSATYPPDAGMVLDPTNLTVYIRAGGMFDNTSYNNTSATRAKIMIFYLD